jgi:hypothetical protein
LPSLRSALWWRFSYMLGFITKFIRKVVSSQQLSSFL